MFFEQTGPKNFHIKVNTTTTNKKAAAEFVFNVHKRTHPRTTEWEGPIRMQLFALSSDTEIMHELGNNTSMVGDFPIKFSITTKS